MLAGIGSPITGGGVENRLDRVALSWGARWVLIFELWVACSDDFSSSMQEVCRKAGSCSGQLVQVANPVG